MEALPSLPEETGHSILWELATPLQRLRAELYETSEVSLEHVEFVRSEKLNLQAVEAHAGVLVVRPVRFFPNRTFDLAINGVLSVVIEVFDDDDETVIDLVAWPVNRPEKFATAFGYAEALGLAQVCDPETYVDGQPLRIHQTPLAWVKAGCNGVVILRETSAFLWLPRALGNLAAEDLAHGQRVARLLHSFFDPARIVVPARKAA